MASMFKNGTFPKLLKFIVLAGVVSLLAWFCRGCNGCQQIENRTGEETIDSTVKRLVEDKIANFFSNIGIVADNKVDSISRYDARDMILANFKDPDIDSIGIKESYKTNKTRNFTVRDYLQYLLSYNTKYRIEIGLKPGTIKFLGKDENGTERYSVLQTYIKTYRKTGDYIYDDETIKEIEVYVTKNSAGVYLIKFGTIRAIDCKSSSEKPENDDTPNPS